ncbi:MAG TPA: arginine deiminase family protein [Bryobacteraceae bacterium]|nr:arginine deiminase family protein [Bryobacteraceae bacterium]
MLIALTRAVSPAINQCELGYIERQEIDLDKAIEQHRRYEACLAELGAKVVSLPAEPDYPDSVFVEDPAVVVDEIAIMTRMGAASRRGEAESLGHALARYRPLRWMREPAALEGGDVMRIERTLFVGVSHRTNSTGIEQLREELGPLGYTVTPVEVRGALHLKTAVCYLGDGEVLANRGWVDLEPLREFRVLDVAAGEPRAANVLALGDSVIIPECFPRTAEILQRSGRKVRTVDVSELMKAEAGVSCSSLIFEWGQA